MQVDYIIVGLGLAGFAFVRELEKNDKSFIVFEDESQRSSMVAGGMYNPVILKRFTPVWNAVEQLELALPFYKELEDDFKKVYHYSVDICRIFKSIEEQNNWFLACDKPKLSKFMIPKVFNDKINGIKMNFGFGKLSNTGRIDTKLLLEDFRNYLKSKKLLLRESFNYNQLKVRNSAIEYQDITSNKVVFCEGFGLKKNPFFNYLPMQEAKGELLIIKAPKLKIDYLIKAAIFIMPLGNDLYKIGSTFNWKDKTTQPSKSGKEELINKLSTVLDTPYEIIDHIAGIRPTVKDRRPLVGKHPKIDNMAVLNGLGTRGVMIAPMAAKALYNNLENGIAISSEITIDRF